MDSPNTNNTTSDAFIRQSFLRGHLAPAFPPPRKHCQACRRAFSGIATHCIPCRKASSLAKLSKAHLDTCGTCRQRTLHIPPGLCTACCKEVEGEDVQLYCPECEAVFDLPYLVRGADGVVVCMLDVEVECGKCGGLTDSLL